MNPGEFSSIGFIGLGDIGLPMACRLAEVGFSPLVFDLRKECIQEAVRHGARAAASLEQIARECACVMITVVDAAQVRSLVEGVQGLFARARKGTIFLCHSTMTPQEAQNLAARAEESGMAWLDAPMSGGSIGARSGSLAFLVGGDRTVFDRCKPVFDAMGHHAFHLGAVGSAQAAKLANAILCHLNFLVAIEALRLSEAHGIPEAVMIEIARLSTGKNWVIDHWGHMEATFSKRGNGEYGVEFSRRIRKDLSYALSVGHVANLPLPLTALGVELYPGAVRQRLEAGVGTSNK